MAKVKYILANFLKLFFISSICLLLLFFIIQILDDLPDIISGEKVFLFSSYLYSLPSSFVQISPLITLLSGMFLASEMMKSNEIKIFEISGINTLKVFSIFLFAAFLISIFTFYIKNFVVPQITKTESTQKPISFSSSSLLFKSDLFEGNGKFKNVEISIISKEGDIHSLKAKEGIYLGEKIWKFYNGTTYLIDKNGALKKSESFNSKTLEFPLSSEMLIIAGKNPDSLKLKESKRVIKELKELGFYPFLLQTSYIEKISYPLLNFFILLIVFPFFLVKQKITRFFVLSSTIVLGFLSYGIYSFFIALAKEGKILPFLGGWGFHLLIFLLFIIVSASSYYKNLSF